ncbi:hypothetical protein L2E82_17046 [Cichorium intybus]|uniref:Uncharacterized protein n=1 Tax=Cichorium intybus TaxID=13427 RepID=A0ACB9F774_CICIN|nr:hypothetical protein L2E82_17046 [Cichorium intybus]
MFSSTSVESQFKNSAMNTAQVNFRITGDHSTAAINSSSSSFLDCKRPKLLMRLEEYEEHKELKDIISIVQDDDDCSIESCELDRKTLAFLIRSEIERFSCNEGDEDRKDDLSNYSRYNKKGKAVNRDEEENHRSGSSIDTDGVVNNVVGMQIKVRMAGQSGEDGGS